MRLFRTRRNLRASIYIWLQEGTMNSSSNCRNIFESFPGVHKDPMYLYCYYSIMQQPRHPLDGHPSAISILIIYSYEYQIYSCSVLGNKAGNITMIRKYIKELYSRYFFFLLLFFKLLFIFVELSFHTVYFGYSFPSPNSFHIILISPPIQLHDFSLFFFKKQTGQQQKQKQKI